MPSGLGADQALIKVSKLGSSVGLFAIVTGLWPATAYGAGLSRAFTRLTPKKDVKARGLRGRAMALVVLLPLFAMGVLIASFAGTSLAGGSWLGTLLGWVIALTTGFAVAAVAMALIYRVFPPVKLKWNAIWRGVLTAGISISVLSLLFTIYLELGSDFQAHYATSGLAGIVLLAVWLFLANALLLSATKPRSKRADLTVSGRGRCWDLPSGRTNWGPLRASSAGTDAWRSQPAR
jgi:uncharacterized BrkB/YihY/UPF0761 family membrane protein